jgi:penicillin amidase
LVLLVVLAAPLPASSDSITWDRWGVPHVIVAPEGSRLEQMRALGTAAGYATARDRMYQLEITRRAATGRLSELPFTRQLLSRDVIIRRDGLTDRERTAVVRRLPTPLRTWVVAFADGVNRYLDEIRTDPTGAPARLSFPGLSPSTIEPWRPEDTAALAEVTRAGEFGGNELRNAVTLLDLLARFPEAEARGIFDDGFWQEDPSAPTTIPRDEGQARPQHTTPYAPEQMQLLQRYEAAIRQVAAQVEEEQPLVGSSTPASIGLAVAGRRTASGAPILLGGAQVGLRLPNPFHEIGLHGAGFDAELFVSVNGLTMGRTARTAWTLTSSFTDTIDWYVEELHPTDPHRYRFRGRWRNMSCREEVFLVAEQAPLRREVCRTVHGPVAASFPADGVAFAQRRYTAGHELASTLATLALATATDVKRFLKQADRIQISTNLLYADADGTIAFATRGVAPRRSRRVDPRFPLPGNGSAEPAGMITGRRMPTLVNPDQGYLVQWDNKPIVGWQTGAQRELWGTVDRVRGLAAPLDASTGALTVDDVAAIMRTAATSDVFAARIVPSLRAAVDAVGSGSADGPRLAAAMSLVEAWRDAGAPLRADASGFIPHPGLTIYREWRTRAQRATFADELGTHRRDLFYFDRATLSNWDDSALVFTPDSLFVRAIEGPAAALPPSRDYFADVATGANPGRDQVLVAALRDTLDGLAMRYGTVQMTEWLWPRIEVRYFDDSGHDLYFGPTVVERADRNAFDFLLELTPESTGRAILAPGNSDFVPVGVLGERNVNDQLAMYDGFAYRAWPFRAWEEPHVEEFPRPTRATSSGSATETRPRTSGRDG